MADSGIKADRADTDMAFLRSYAVAFLFHPYMVAAVSLSLCPGEVAAVVLTPGDVVLAEGEAAMVAESPVALLFEFAVVPGVVSSASVQRNRGEVLLLLMLSKIDEKHD